MYYCLASFKFGYFAIVLADSMLLMGIQPWNGAILDFTRLINIHIKFPHTGGGFKFRVYHSVCSLYVCGGEGGVNNRIRIITAVTDVPYTAIKEYFSKRF